MNAEQAQEYEELEFPDYLIMLAYGLDNTTAKHFQDFLDRNHGEIYPLEAWAMLERLAFNPTLH